MVCVSMPVTAQASICVLTPSKMKSNDRWVRRTIHPQAAVRLHEEWTDKMAEQVVLLNGNELAADPAFHGTP